LFGFINATEEINTQGIGLGLHISKQIVLHLGGEIVCKSKWGKGSTFVCLVSIENIVNSHQMLKRCVNPEKLVYMKIDLDSCQQNI